MNYFYIFASLNNNKVGKIKDRYKDTKMNTANRVFADSETGEVIDASGFTLLKRTSTGEITISSKAYVYLDTDQLFNLLANGITQVELALLITISSNLLIGSNVCMKNEDKPHSTESIAKLIGTTPQSVKLKLNRLEKLGVLHYGIMKENKMLGKVYIVNPHIIRKGHKLKGSLKTMFDDIKKKY